MDHKLNYWIESVQSSFDENNISVSKDVVAAVAKDMLNSSECQSLAFGHDTIKSSNTKVDELTKRYEAKISELEERDRIFRESVAKRRGVSPEDVYIEHGSVMYNKP